MGPLPEEDGTLELLDLLKLVGEEDDDDEVNEDKVYERCRPLKLVVGVEDICWECRLELLCLEA